MIVAFILGWLAGVIGVLMYGMHQVKKGEKEGK